MPPPKKQFSRPSVSLGSTGPSRKWGNVAAEVLEEGDLIGGRGLIHRVEIVGEHVSIWSGTDEEPYVYRVGSAVWAFH